MSAQPDFFGDPNVIPITRTPPKRIDPNGAYTPAFDELWRIHPQGGKRPAFKAYLKAVPSKISQAEAMTFLEHYREGLRDGFGGAHLSTWLNQEYWEQEREKHPQHGRNLTSVAPGSAARFF